MRQDKKLIDKLLKTTKILLKRFQELAGKLQQASMGMIPGSTGLFSPLQMAMSGNPKFITVMDYLQETLKDWRSIIQHMKLNPTSVLQLIKYFPNFIGYSDACKLELAKYGHPALNHVTSLSGNLNG